MVTEYYDNSSLDSYVYSSRVSVVPGVQLICTATTNQEISSVLISPRFYLLYCYYIQYVAETKPTNLCIDIIVNIIGSEREVIFHGGNLFLSLFTTMKNFQ